MKWAAASLLALSALCMPAALLAEEETLTAAAATAALRGFGGAFLRSCFPNLPDPRPLRIALAEMASSSKLSDAATRTITDRIEAGLEKDPLFVVVPRRLNAELSVAREELLRLRSSAPDTPVDGLVTIKLDADANGRAVVNVVAYTANLECQRSADAGIRVGEIKDPADDPEAFFRAAARELDDKQIERLVVMPPEIGIGIGAGLSSQAMVQQLQEQLVAAIRRTFQNRSRLRFNDAPVPAVGLYGDGMAAAEAWHAKLRLGRSPRGIEVHVEFRSPGSPQRIFDVPGHFAPDILPTNLDPPVLRMRAAKTPFKVNEDPLDVQIEVLRGPSRLFCFFLEPNGEATLLYPTHATLSGNLFTPGKKQFPRDFFVRMTRPWLLDAANDFFFYCVATQRPLPDELQAQWLQNTVQARQERHDERKSIDPDTTRQILSALRQSEGYAEASTEIVSK
jgi:hypothetical protein